MATVLLTGAATKPAPITNPYPLGVPPGMQPTPTPQPAQAAVPAAPQPAPQAAQPAAPVTLQDGTQLDSGVIKVLHAIRNVESNGDYNASGDGGTSAGAFQWNNYINGQHVPLQQGQIPANFQNAAHSFGLDPNDFSPANQNKVAYAQIAAYKAQGLTPLSIDALWNGAKPDPANQGQYVHNNPARISIFQTALQQEATAAPQAAQPGVNQQAPEAPPSVGGFLGNVVTSGANFLGNIGDAALHPIKTVQNVGGAAVGGLQELGGQQNENTQKFDNLIGFFKDRYGSVGQLEHTIYSDPVGFAADLSAVLGGGAAIVSKVGTVAGVADASRAADLAAQTGLRTMAGDTAVGNAATRTAGVLSKASTLTNPLTPVVAGASSLISKTAPLTKYAAGQLTGLEPKTIEAILKHPDEFTPQQISSASRSNIASDVETALQDRIASLHETGSAYDPIRTAGSIIPVAKNFLETQLRTVAKVNVVDGEISASGSSVVRNSKDIKALQNVYDLWKPEFQKSNLTSEQFLNFRSDLANAAKFDREFSSSKPVEGVAAKIRDTLNTTYRPNIAGLAELDAKFSTELTNLKELRKGFIDKEGNLTESAVNKIANAGGTGKDQLLARLEKIVPGITKKLEVQKAIEDIQKASGTKVGTHTKSIAETGGAILGITTGNVPLIAFSLATAIFTAPQVAVPLMRAFSFDPAISQAVIAKLAKMTTATSRLNAATQTPSTTPQTQSTAPQTSPDSLPTPQDAHPSAAIVSSPNATTN